MGGRNEGKQNAAAFNMLQGSLCALVTQILVFWSAFVSTMMGSTKFRARTSLTPTCNCASTVCPKTRFRIGGAVEILA